MRIYRLAAIFLLVPFVAPVASALGQCPAPAAWFPHSSTPEPDFHKPSSDCEFHQWAWQEFLFLTKPTAKGRIGLLDLPTEASLFSAGRAPASLDSDHMQQRMKSQTLRLKARTTKTAGPTTINDIQQAGSRGVLVDKAGRPLYYASFVTPDYYNFVRNNELYLKAKYLAADASLNFPTKSVELKSSWMVVPPGMNASNYYTTTAFVPKLVCKANGPNCTAADIEVDLTNEEKVTVALVGLHVVGVVDGHPEFIWATFEHVNNAPDLPAGMKPSDASVVDSKDWTFYAKGTLANQCNQWDATKVTLDSAKQVLSPSANVFRQFAFGGGNANDTSNIQSLNQSVHSQLDAKSVWKNYALVGGVWFVDGSTQLKPGLSGPGMQSLVVGSVQVSNSTMETFTQNLNVAGKSNCFVCHNTSADFENGLPAKNLNLSHILKQGLVDREQFAQLASFNLSKKNFDALSLGKKNLKKIGSMSAEELKSAATPAKATPLQSYADVQKFLDQYVANNNVRINSAPHGPFWRSMTYDQFVNGDIPKVGDPETGKPLKVMIVKDSAHSNFIMALSGTPGSIFDPNKGSIGQMPPSGPFMPPQDIALLAAWIDQGAPE